jgi:predicted transcriptional regulator
LKDKNDVELNKRTIINQIKKINKEDLFTKTEEKPKYNLWQKIKVMIWGT